MLAQKPLTKEESAKIIEAAIRKAAKKPTGKLTATDFEKVRMLNLNNNQLTSVKGLEKLTQLRLLDLNRNPDLNKAQINKLQNSVPKCKIYSNPPLTKEESAKVIEVAIREAAKKPTGKLTKADYEKVTRLAFFSQQLTDVKGMEKLNKLTRLNLGQNQLTKVKGLEKLTQLERLNLGDNQLTDVKGLEKLDQLKTLYLHINQLTDVKALEKLMNLTVLDIRYNPALTKTQIAELQKALPKCEIYSNHAK